MTLSQKTTSSVNPANRGADTASVVAAADDAAGEEEGSPVLLPVAVGDDPLPVKMAVLEELGVGV